jgi:hypothetical protein
VSLRKSPQLTPKLLAAIRKNAQLSTGPRTAAGKQNSKLNALKHGGYAALANHHQTMLALGEDLEEFDKLKQELMTALGPGDAVWEKQVEHLARLCWRRQRLERAQKGVVRRALLAVQNRQHRRREEMAGGATIAPSQPEILDPNGPHLADPGALMRKILSYVEVIREQARQSSVRPQLVFVFEKMPGIDVPSGSSATEGMQ